MRQSKWEDLQLQSDHPFVDKNKTPVPFVQKQQLSTNKGGIAFVSKGNPQQAKEVVAQGAMCAFASYDRSDGYFGETAQPVWSLRSHCL